jgi:hypothetical protein
MILFNPKFNIFPSTVEETEYRKNRFWFELIAEAHGKTTAWGIQGSSKTAALQAATP